MKSMIFILFIIAFGFSFASWERCDSGMYGGTIKFISAGKIHENNTDFDVFTGTYDGVYLSIDNGLNWTKKSDRYATSVLINGDTILACLEYGFAYSYDYGETWVDTARMINKWGKVDSILINGKWSYFPEDVKINKFYLNNRILYAATSAGPFYSNDWGKTWEQYDSLLSTVIFRDFISAGNNLIARTLKGLFISTDNGESWESKVPGQIICFAVKDNYVLTGSESGEVYLSSDYGINWSNKSEGLPFRERANSIILVNERIIVNLATIEDFSLAGIYVSSDFGESWHKTSSFNNPDVPHFIVQDSVVFAMSSSNGLWKSTNYGESWININKGLTVQLLTKLSQIGKKIFVGTIGGGVFISEDVGNSFHQASSGLKNIFVNTISFNDNKLYSGTSGSGIFVSNNHGENWESFSNGLTSTNIKALASFDEKLFAGASNSYITAPTDGIFIFNENLSKWEKKNSKFTTIYNEKIVSFAKIGNSIFAASGGYGVTMSTDNGETWALENQGLDYVTKQVSAMTAKDNYLFTQFFYIIYRYDVSSRTWTEKNSGIVDSRIVAFAVAGDNIYAANNAGNGGMYLSSDNGENWNKLNINTQIYSIATYDSIVFAGGRSGTVFISSDSGKSWRSESFANFDVTALYIFDNYLYAGTAGNGLWRAPLSDFGIVSVSEQAETQYLYSYKPYPIPATERVSMLVYWDTSLDIEKDDIAVYDIYGRKVAGRESITIDKQAEFKGIITWNCSAAPDGVYLLRITHGSLSQSVKVVVRR